MINKIYIIGEVPSILDINCILKFNFIKINLLRLGFKVFNPLDNLNIGDAYSIEVQKMNKFVLLNCDAVYIIPNIKEDINNPEITITKKHNKIRISDTLTF